MTRRTVLTLSLVAAVLAPSANSALVAQRAVLGIFPPQRRVPIRDPATLPAARIPSDIAPPPTVSTRAEQPPEEPFYLDEAIRQALRNADAIRVLSANGAASTGQTIYDPAIVTTRIDQRQAIFDPTFEMRHDFFRNETPLPLVDPLDPSRAIFEGTRSDIYDTSLGVSKQLQTGGRATLQTNVDRIRRTPRLGDLNPDSRSSLDLSVTQPLLRGAGVAVNRVPILLARIDAETSYFRLKDSVQETVRGVIQGYWDLVAARTNVWAIEQQVKQAEFAVRRETMSMQIGSSNKAQYSQALLALTNFRANLIAARSTVLDREASLRGILGLPPTSPDALIPLTAPVTTRYEFDWEGLLQLAERYRPDIIELKLILEADYQLLLQATNRALPQFDAVMLYRWNGLEGELPVGSNVRTEPGAFTDWQLGVNFSVPLGLRQSRAQLREQELIISRDRVNLDQAMLQVVHDLASNLRRIDRLFSRYEAFTQTRMAAIDNLEQQLAGFNNGSIDFINVLQALTDWGNSVSNEAAALAQYNVELANLEQQTGTLLESHGIRFYEERYRSLGPLGILGGTRPFPRDLRPSDNLPRYENSDQPVDAIFRQDAPEELLDRRSRSLNKASPEPMPLPPPEPTPPER